MQCTKEMLDNHFEHRSAYARDAFCRQCANLCLENIMQEALYNFNGTISINGREISNLRFADDIDLITGTEEEPQ